MVDIQDISLLLGTNGYIWIQRKLPEEDAPLAEHFERLKQQHAQTPVLPDERQGIARIRNSIACLAKVHLLITPEHIQLVLDASKAIPIAEMMHPDNVLLLTHGLFR
jgi:hypothetical protein